MVRSASHLGMRGGGFKEGRKDGDLVKTDRNGRKKGNIKETG